MAKAYSCDECSTLITDKDIRIELKGYEVFQNRENRKMPKGYAIGKQEEFCSFTCLAK